MMQLPLLFRAFASVAIINCIALDFNLDGFNVDGPANDLFADSLESDLPADNSISYGFPDDSNLDMFGQSGDLSAFDSSSHSTDEPVIDPSVLPSDDLNTNLFGDSDILDPSFQSNSILADAVPSDSANGFSDCANFFGLACCTGGSDHFAGNSLTLQAVSGCSGRMCSYFLLQVRTITFCRGFIRKYMWWEIILLFQFSKAYCKIQPLQQLMSSDELSLNR